MEDLAGEFDGGGFVGVILLEGHVEEEHCPPIGCPLWAEDGTMPCLEVALVFRAGDETTHKGVNGVLLSVITLTGEGEREAWEMVFGVGRGWYKG